jgi:zinc transporter, ZIP family
MTEQPTKNRFTFRTLVLLLLPIVALAGVIFLFLSTGGGLDFQSAAPIEDLTIERYELSPGHIDIYVRNSGPETLTIAQAIINEAVWPVEVYARCDHSPSRAGHYSTWNTLVLR